MYAHFFKRIIDFSIALMVLLAISPVLLVITILLYVFNEGAGAFFLQERPGLHGKIFKIIKFKTMNERKDASGRLLPDVQRITKFGRFVRNTSIDELPQLFNVLKGEMSIVGPRPERPFFVKQFIAQKPEYDYRHNVKPGITGLAQIAGKYNTSAYDKMIYDLLYIQDVSVKTDLMIMLQTFKVLLTKSSTEGVK